MIVKQDPKPQLFYHVLAMSMRHRVETREVWPEWSKVWLVSVCRVLGTVVANDTDWRA